MDRKRARYNRPVTGPCPNGPVFKRPYGPVNFYLCIMIHDMFCALVYSESFLAKNL